MSDWRASAELKDMLQSSVGHVIEKHNDVLLVVQFSCVFLNEITCLKKSKIKKDFFPVNT